MENPTPPSNYALDRRLWVNLTTARPPPTSSNDAGSGTGAGVVSRSVAVPTYSTIRVAAPLASLQESASVPKGPTPRQALYLKLNGFSGAGPKEPRCKGNVSALM